MVVLQIAPVCLCVWADPSQQPSLQVPNLAALPLRTKQHTHARTLTHVRTHTHARTLAHTHTRTQALYSQNFESYHIAWLGVFIEGYPMLMIVLFPLIAISLRNNLLELFFLMKQTCKSKKTIQELEEEPAPVDREKTKLRVAVATLCAALYVAGL